MISDNKTASRIGIYFSDNDIVYDWTIAFLNSLQTLDLDLNLILIPFNDNCDRQIELQERYQFEIYIDPTFDRLN